MDNQIIVTDRTKPSKTVHDAIISKLSQNMRITKKEAKRFVQALIFSIVDELEIEGDQVYIAGMGTFTVVKIKGKVDELSGKRIKREDKIKIGFTPSSRFLPYSEQDKLDIINKKNDKDK